MFNLGTPEIVIIAAVIIMLFGADKIPELARGIGKASREFRKGLTGDEPEPTKKTKSKEAAQESPVDL